MVHKLVNIYTKL